MFPWREGSMTVNDEEYAIRPPRPTDGSGADGAAIEQALSDRIARREARSSGVPKTEVKRVTLRLPLAVIDHFMAKGPDWRERLVEVIKREVEHANDG